MQDPESIMNFELKSILQMIKHPTHFDAMECTYMVKYKNGDGMTTTNDTPRSETDVEHDTDDLHHIGVMCIETEECLAPNQLLLTLIQKSHDDES